MGRPFPDLPGGAVVSITSDDSVNQWVEMRVGSANVWLREVPSHRAVAQLGLVPDLNYDRIREVRVRLVPTANPHQLTLAESTWIISGRTGELLFVIFGNAPFDPWANPDPDTQTDEDAIPR